MSEESSRNDHQQHGKIGHNSKFVNKRMLERIEYIQAHELKFHENNPRKHSKRQEKALDHSVAANGIVLPILIDGDGVIIAGEA